MEALDERQRQDVMKRAFPAPLGLPNLSFPSRRGVLAMLAGLTASAARAVPDSFAAVLQSLWPEAQAQGVRREIFDGLVTALAPDLTLPRSGGGQPEFERPLQAYYREAVSAGRIAQGRSRAASYADTLAADQRRFGVPGEICLAAWGMESDYGRTRGTRDILRTVATLAWMRRDRPAFRDEFVAAVVILDRGLVSRERLVGSWAGAMGDPQFLPSAYLKYAVNASGDAATPDIWGRPPDILASIANFLRTEGWTPGEPWIEEVVIPDGFEYPTLHASAADWSRLGLRRPAGPPPEGGSDAALFLPAGATGPAFLLYPNYFVIKQYNNSDSYALSLGSLAQRIAGAPPLATAWPARAINLSRADKTFVQTRLAALGLYDGAQDGKFGPKARDAIHAYQKRAGLTPADGFATPALVASLRSR